jgi:hypothetical protein
LIRETTLTLAHTPLPLFFVSVDSAGVIERGLVSVDSGRLSGFEKRFHG